MKKITAFIFAALLALGSAACTNDGKTHIRLSEVTHSIFYAPLYVAINNGYFDEYDIKIDLSTAGGSDKVMTSIASKSADVGLLGPEATIYCHIEGQRDYPVIFGQLTKRDGSFLVSKKAEPDFKWTDLENKHVLAGRPGGMPAMTLQYVCNNNGLYHGQNVNLDTTVAFDMMIGAFENSSEYDYCTMFEPNATDCVKRGKGHIVAFLGTAGGSVPYTAFSASKSYISKNRETLRNFLRAIIKGYDFIKNSDFDTVGKVLSKSFPAVDVKSLSDGVKNYFESDAYAETPIMSEADFMRLQDIMSNAGTLTGRVNFSDCVDNTIAQSVI